MTQGHKAWAKPSYHKSTNHEYTKCYNSAEPKDLYK